MSSERTLVILPMINENYRFKFFLDNYREIFRDKEEFDLFFLIHKASARTNITIRETLGLTKQKLHKITDTVTWDSLHQYGFISSKNTYININKMLFPALKSINKKYSKYVFVRPNTYVTRSFEKVLADFNKEMLIDNVFIQSEKVDFERCIPMSFIHKKHDKDFAVWLDNGKKTDFSIFREKNNIFLENGVLICRDNIFQEIRSTLFTGNNYIDDINESIVVNGLGICNYVHNYKTIHLEGSI